MERIWTSMRTANKSNIWPKHDNYVLLLGEKRCEILEGDLYVVPAPSIRNQRISRNLEFALFQHIRSHDLGELLCSPCDVILSEENIVQPDILFVRQERRGIIGELNLRGAPDLVIKILSEPVSKKELGIQRKIYSSFGIQEYWIVDPRAYTVEILLWSELGYISAGVYNKLDRLCSPLLPSLELLLSEVFPD